MCFLGPGSTVLGEGTLIEPLEVKMEVYYRECHIAWSYCSVAEFCHDRQLLTRK
jgi:hypothetical protein